MRILFLDIDTLRPDHLGCYGYLRNTSPNIDALAADGMRFENYYVTDAPCLPSRMALATGQFGIHNGVVNHGGRAADLRREGMGRGFMSRLSRESLAGFLRHRKLRTASISLFADRHGAWEFNAGFDEVYNVPWYNAENVNPIAEEWLKRNAGVDNWFLHVNYWDPHTPYRAPADYGNPFEGQEIPPWPDQAALDEHWGMVGPHHAQEVTGGGRESPSLPRQPAQVRNREDLRRLFDGYDTGIRYVDDHIGRLLNICADAGVLDDLLIIVTSDHGENMGELGIYAEHATADAVTPHVPMIIRMPAGRPGVLRGGVDAGLHYHIDLLPTLADILETEPPAAWDGISYAAALVEATPPPEGEGTADASDIASGGSTKGARPYLVVSQCAHTLQRGVRFDNYHYIRTYHDGWSLFQRDMLFDVSVDPHETTDLAHERRDLVLRAVSCLADWHDEMMMSMPYGADNDPLWTAWQEGGPHHASGGLRNYVTRLEETGRGWAVPELKKRHPREFAH